MVKLLKVLILPLAIFLILIKKILKVNFHVIAIDKIGHLNAETFIYHNFRDQNSFITKNFFLVRKKPSNIFNFEMWKRTVKFRKDNFFLHTLRSLIFYFDKKYNINSKNLSFIVYEKKNPIYFTRQEEKLGDELLEKLNIKNSKWICIHNRDNAFSKYERSNVKDKKNFDNYTNQERVRNFKIESLNKAALSFIQAGYNVIRMGSKSEGLSKINNEKYLDYSKSSYKSDFADIYLLAKCELFFGGDTGMNSIPRIFKRNYSCVNQPFLINYHRTNYFNSIPFIPKILFDIRENKLIRFNDYFKRKLYRDDPIWSFDFAGIKFLDNTEDEINELAIECLKILNSSMKYSNDEIKLQEKYHKFVNSIPQKNFKKNYQKLNLGISFLKKHENLLLA